ncbi:hypothetical protein ACIQW7_24320 [Peribacillus simplex]|uniref:hypothetical protein n=1 Tax=Peribacillus simplex TaxID=1478 RepID=UPI0037F9BC81
MFNNPKVKTVIFLVCLALLFSVVELFASTPKQDVAGKKGVSNDDYALETTDLNVVNSLSGDEPQKESEQAIYEVKQKSIDTSKAKVIKKNKEITDLDSLYKRAKKGQTDFSGEAKFKGKAKITKDPSKSSKGAARLQEEEEIELEVEQTSQLLEKLENPDGTEVENYVITSFVTPTESDIEDGSDSDLTNGSDLNVTKLSNTNSSNNVQLMADRYDDEWDRTIGVKAYSRIYVTVSTDSKGRKWWDLSRSKGGWKVTQDNYSLSNQRVRLNQTGVGVSGAVNKKKDYYPKGKTFDIPAESSWPKVSASTSGAGAAVIGSGQYVKIKRGSTSWQFDWANNW